MCSSGRFSDTTRACTSRRPSARGTRTSALPATPRSRSNHVCQIPPPYVSTDASTDPLAAVSDRGFSRSAGLSVCAPATANATRSSSTCAPTANACTAAPFRVKKYRLPRSSRQCAFSSSSSKPASSSISRTTDAATNGDPDARVKNFAKFSASFANTSFSLGSILVLFGLMMIGETTKKKGS